MVIFISYYDFPCSEPVLENIFSKEIGKNVKIIWLFQGNIKNKKEIKWNNSNVILLKKIKGESLICKLANKFLSAMKFFYMLKLLINFKVKIILIRDMPGFFLMTLPFKFFFKFKLYFQYTAPLGDISLGYYRLIKKTNRFWHLINGYRYNYFVKLVFKFADIIFPISEFYKKELAKYNEEKKIVPLTMGVDYEWIKRKRDEIEFLRNLKRNNYLLVYFGSLSFVRNPKFILEVFYKVLNKQQRCILLIIGKTAKSWEKNHLIDLCNEMKIMQNTIFCGFLSRNTLQDYLQYCDISISAIPPENYYRLSSPTKIYESLGNGIPVVANKGICEQEKVILESGGGIICDYKPECFADEILKLLKNSSLRKKMAENGKNYVIKHYSFQKLSKDIYPYFEGA